MRTFIAIAALALSVLTAQAAEGIPKFQRDTNYTVARSKLIALQWKPVKLSEDKRLCERREETCDTFEEAESCAPNGAGVCSMLWSKAGKVIAVQTYGDNNVLVRHVSCKSGC